MKKTLYCGAGYLSLLLGVIGVFLPIVPTAPFIILAAFCFSRGSERLHSWMRNHRLFGHIVTDWEDSGVIHLRAKIFATCMIALALIYPLGFAPIHMGLKIFIAAVCSGVLLFIWSRPSTPQ